MHILERGGLARAGRSHQHDKTVVKLGCLAYLFYDSIRKRLRQIRLPDITHVGILSQDLLYHSCSSFRYRSWGKLVRSESEVVQLACELASICVSKGTSDLDIFRPSRGRTLGCAAFTHSRDITSSSDGLLVFSEPRPPLGQRRAASLPRVSGPLQEERPNMDVGARRSAIDPNRFQRRALRDVPARRTEEPMIRNKATHIKRAQESPSPCWLARRRCSWWA